MDFFEEVKRITRAHCEIMGYPVPRFYDELRWGVNLTIPPSLLKPTSGPCLHCHHDTEDKHGGEWMHDECNDALIAEQREDERLDDPRHGQASEINRGR